MSICLRIFSLLLMTFALLFGAGCGGERLPPHIANSSPVRALVIRVMSAENAPQLGAHGAVVEALRSAGYQVIQGEGWHDVTAAVDVEVGPVGVGGILVIRGMNAVRLTLTLSANGQIIEQIRTEFTAGERGVEVSDLDDLMRVVTLSSKVHGLAVATLRARAAEAWRAAQAREAARVAFEREREAARLAREEEERRARAEEAAAWQGARPAACIAPTAVDACDGVSGYLAKYPAREHSVEARELLGKAEEPIRSLRDDAAWAEIDLQACEKPKTEDACESVVAYLKLYPKPNHAERAQASIDKAEAALKRLRVARERREAANDARERATAERESQAEDGGTSYGGGRSRGSGGSVQVRGYTKKNGTYVAPHTRRRR